MGKAATLAAGISCSIFSAAGSMRSAGMMLPGNGWRPVPLALPVAGSKITAPVPEKSPRRSASVGTVRFADAVCRRCRALPVGEEEQLVLLDRPAERAAELVLDVLGDFRPDEEVVPRPQRAVGVEPVAGAMEGVGARLDRDAHGGAARHALLGVEAVGDDVDGLHRFGRRHVGHDVRQPGVAHRRAVEPRVVVGP